MCICVGPHDPDIKPSRGRQGKKTRFSPCKRRGSKVLTKNQSSAAGGVPRLVLAEFAATWNKVTATPRSYWRGCASLMPRFRG